MIVSPQVKPQNLQPMQRQPFSKRPKFQKESFFEERMFFIGENPYDKPHIRHLKFWTRTQLHYYASVLCGRNKIFQHRHIPHVELEEIPCWLQSSTSFMKLDSSQCAQISVIGTVSSFFNSMQLFTYQEIQHTSTHGCSIG